MIERQMDRQIERQVDRLADEMNFKFSKNCRGDELSFSDQNQVNGWV